MSIFPRRQRGERRSPIADRAARTPLSAPVAGYPPKPAPWLAYDATPAPAPAPVPVRGVPGCRCPECEKLNASAPGTEAVLYPGPDAAWLSERAAIRDGRHVDAMAYADEAELSIAASFDAASRHVRRTLGAFGTGGAA